MNPNDLTYDALTGVIARGWLWPREVELRNFELGFVRPKSVWAQALTI
jgi:hypothetical protein